MAAEISPSLAFWVQVSKQRPVKYLSLTIPNGSACPGQVCASNFCIPFLTGFRPTRNLTIPQRSESQTLADRRPHANAEAVAARFGLRSGKQAYLGRHPTTAFLNIGLLEFSMFQCRPTVLHDCDSHFPTKSPLIDLELTHLSIGICALS